MPLSTALLQRADHVQPRLDRHRHELEVRRQLAHDPDAPLLQHPAQPQVRIDQAERDRADEEGRLECVEHQHRHERQQREPDRRAQRQRDELPGRHQERDAGQLQQAVRSRQQLFGDAAAEVEVDEAHQWPDAAQRAGQRVEVGAVLGRHVVRQPAEADEAEDQRAGGEHAGEDGDQVGRSHGVTRRWW